MSPFAHSHKADSNLLFGIIALQMDFISRDQLIAAMNAWVLDKQKPLGQVLCEQGALSAEDHQAIESLVRRHLLRHDNDPERSLAALSAIGQRLRQDLSRIADPDVQASLPRVSATERDSESTLTYVGSPTTPGGRFRILRPHAQGGLGVVSVALDEELHREVALKEIQERYASDEQPRLRFLLEAEITGGLEHPGIVPVYGLGHHPDGRPFYAMRFVRGESLKEAIEAFHQRAATRFPSPQRGEGARRAAAKLVDQRDLSPSPQRGEGARRAGEGAGANLVDQRDLSPSPQRGESRRAGRRAGEGAGANRGTLVATPLAFRRLLSRFLDVCNAIAYAHSRGVLHRDIKPGNILLGPYGETLVVDWGLAKIVGRDEPATSDPSAEPTLRPPSASGTGETVPGTAMGTPAYMSPEQAEGRLDLLGPASDVYSLGATLYVVLTGRAPFDGGDAAEVLPKVQRGEFTRPRVVDTSIPKPLEAICLKAMALKPADRYVTPRALAEDIEHWLADEPVSAYREPWPDRARRWSRKHRTLVTSAAAVLLLGLLGKVGFAAVVTAKNRELARQTQRAESRERMAIDAVKRFRDVVVEEPALQKNPALEELRKKLLREPLAFFQSLRGKLQGERDTRPEAMARLAGAAFELGRLTSEIGDKRDALRSYEESLAILGRLARENPSVAEFQRDLASTHNNIGSVQRETGLPELASASYAKALAIRERLAHENPSVTEFQGDLASSHGNTGLLQSITGHPEQALESYGKALAIFERLARESPSVTDFQSRLATTHNNIGLLQSITGHPEQALDSCGKALAIQQRLARENPGVTEFQSNLARSHINVGKLQHDTGHLEQALDSYAKALAVQGLLARENPSVTQFQRLLAGSHNNIGAIQRETGHPDQALESFGKALAIGERLARENPSVTELQSDLAVGHYNIGLFQQRERGRPDAALGSFNKALEIQERLAREHPESPDYASNLGGLLHNMSVIDSGGKHFDQARAKLQQAISWQKKALAANPRHPTYRQFLRNHLTNLINAAKALGKDDEASEAQHELNELAANDPAKAALDQRLAAVIRGEAPKDNRERLQLAYRANEKKLYAASTHLFGDALQADPKLADDRQVPHPYNAACAAALAAGVKTTPTRPSPIKGEEKINKSSPLVGEDLGGGRPAAGGRRLPAGEVVAPLLTDVERARLRNQARTWLEAEMATGTKFLASASREQRLAIAQTLKHWQQDLDLAGVREEAALAELPRDERGEWKKLWGRVDALLAKARTP
jgi:serine/threonine-protein kinase